MSAKNIFENYCAKAFMEVLAGYMNDTGLSAEIVLGQDDEITTLPRIVIAAVDLEEIIFQTGIYRLRLEATVKTDVDTGTPDQSAVLFAAVVDTMQIVDLKERMTSPTLTIQGIVVLDQRPAEIGDRMWNKTASVDFFGYATPA